MTFNPFYLQTAGDAACVVAVICAAIYLSIARSVPSLRYYRWFAVAASVMAVNWFSLKDAPAPTPYLQPVQVVWHLVGVVMVLAFGSGVLELVNLDRPVARRVRWALSLWMVALAGVLLALMFAGYYIPRNWAIFGGYLPYLGLGALMFWSDKREPGVGHLYIGLALLSLPVAALYLVLSKNNTMLMRQMAMGPTLVILLLMLPAAHLKNQRRLRQEVRQRRRAEGKLAAANTLLAQNVAERTRELEQALAAAQSADQAKSRFLAVISHEIRTPLSGLTGMLDLLGGEQLNPDQLDLVATAQASSRQLRSLLDNVIDLSKVEAGMLAMQEAPFSIGALCRTSVQSFVPNASAKGISLTLECPQVAPWMRADAVKIRQVLDNLISNAVKFTLQGGVRVKVSTRVDTHDSQALWLEIEVADTGPGVPLEEQGSIFEAFVQANSMSIEQREHGGSGLGLALCRQLARAMQGDVSYASAPEGGSVLRMCVRGGRVDVETVLAAVAGQRQPLQDDPGDQQPPWLRGKRVLVADDNVLIRKVMARMLARLGADVILAYGGAESVALAKVSAFDLVLMDVSMPDMNGLEATRAIRRLGSNVFEQARTPTDVPIIGISAHALAGDREECLAAGMTDYLTKPIDREQLLAAMRRALSAALASV